MEPRPSKQVNCDQLCGPFSPFTFALQNIKNKLLSSRDHREDQEKFLILEYLDQITSLSIPLKNSENEAFASIQFPIAACSGPKLDFMLRYSGQYGDNNRRADLAKPGEAIKNYLQPYLQPRKDSLGDEIKCINLVKDICEPSQTVLTQYPQSLRNVRGFFKTKLEKNLFFVFISCQPTNPKKTCVLGESSPQRQYCWLSSLMHPKENSNERESIEIKNDCCGELIKIFQNYFLSSATYDALKNIFSSSGTRDVLENLQNSKFIKANNVRPDSPESYRILRDILSTIHESAVRLLPSCGGTAEESNRRIFSMVFVLPLLGSDGELRFRYIFTHDQRQLLKAIDREQFEEAIEKKGKRAYTTLLEDIDEYYHIGNRVNKFDPDCFRKVLQILKKHMDVLGESELEEKNQLKWKIEEHLRTAILYDYAFRRESQEELWADGDLIAYIESEKASIKFGRAFLLDQILKARHPDVMTSMINHLFSKLVQLPTKELLKPDPPGYHDNKLPPAGLHRLETFILHPPLFLYPIYQNDVAVLLCAFDSDLFLGNWQELRSLVDAHKGEIFTAILTDEFNESKKVSARSENIIKSDPIGAANEFIKELRHLMLRFCPNLENIDKINKDTLVNALFSKLKGIVGLDMVRDKSDYDSRVESFKEEVLREMRLMKKSEKAEHLFDYYLKEYVNAYLSMWNLAKLRSETQSLNWAHTISGEFSALRVLFDRFKKGLPPEFQEAYQLPERYLDIQRRNVKALMDLRRLKMGEDIDSGRADLIPVIVESFMIALLRLFTDEEVDYRTSREKLLRPELLSEDKSLKIIDEFLKYFSNLGSISLPNLEKISNLYLKNEANLNLDCWKFANQLQIRAPRYESLLKYSFREIFFNQFKYISYANPRIDISIDGKLFNSNDFIMRGCEQVTVLKFWNTRGDQSTGSDLGIQFLSEIADIAVERYSREGLVKQDGLSFSVAFPVRVYRRGPHD